MVRSRRILWVSAVPLLSFTLLLAGCVQFGGSGDLDSASLNDDAQYLELTYEAEGPLYIEGFWPTESNEFVGGQGETTNVTVSLSPGREAVDASGELVPVVNMTYEADGVTVTHWVHAGTGRIVSVQAALEEPFDDAWSWQASGDPALFGEFVALRKGEIPREIERACCVDSQVFGEPVDASLNMSLAGAEGGVAWLGAETGEGWVPPEPRSVERSEWDGHVFPEPDQGSEFPLSEAVEAIDEDPRTLKPCPETSAYLDEVPSWQVAMAVYWENPGLAITEEFNWNLVLDGDTADEGFQTSVEKQHAPVADESIYRCEEDEYGSDAWVEPDQARLSSYHEAWETARVTVDPDRVWVNGVSVHERTAPVFSAGILFDPYDADHPSVDKVSQALTLDLQTGLLSWYSSQDPPHEVIEQPLDERPDDEGKDGSRPSGASSLQGPSTAMPWPAQVGPAPNPGPSGTR